VRWVSDFDEALSRAVEGGGFADSDAPPDVVLVDYRLGARDGIEWLTEVKNAGCELPVIMLTGQAADQAIDFAAMEAGAADFVHKGTVTADLLDRSIRYAIQQRRTEQQRLRLLEEQARRARAEAASSSKDQFLAALSHELRTPLTPVLLTVHAMQTDATFPQQHRSELEMIRRNVELEARLIDDLLDLTRITQGKLALHREIVDVHSSIEQTLKICSDDELTRKQLRILLELNARSHHVNGDPARLQQICWNLIKNAIKFTDQRGSIIIRTSNLEDGSRGGHLPQIRIDVIDSGVGIERHVLPRIFDAFEQGGGWVTRQFGGLGLGLAITRTLVELHGGAIQAESEGLGRGATFTVHLPTTPAAPRDVIIAPSTNDQNVTTARSPVLRILLVEDHEHTARALARLLRGSSHDVQVARDVASAKELADQHTFDLVISDLGLPDGSGHELMRHLRERYQLRGIALSGYGMESDLARSRDAGFFMHLIKPVNVAELERAITASTTKT
jgi:signal transduction histidine kinase